MEKINTLHEPVLKKYAGAFLQNLPFIIMGVALASWIWFLFWDIHTTSYDNATRPCSYFANYTIKNVPLRCVAEVLK